MAATNRPSSPPGPGRWPDAERLAARVLGWPLAAPIVMLCVAMLMGWIPHYVTWPLFSDADHFATMALAWNSGILPYRDLVCYNFPGQIYLFWALGRLFGWGRTAPFYAADVLLVLTFGIALLLWSWRRTGRLLAGSMGFLAFLAYYLNLPYDLVAQRDWQSALFAVLGLFLLESRPGRAGRLASAVAVAIALVFRPQAVFFFPALALAVDENARKPGESPANTLRACLEWGLALGVSLSLACAPLAVGGVLGDMVRSVRSASYGGAYNKVTVSSFLVVLLSQINFLNVLMILTIMLLCRLCDETTRRMARTWVVAAAGVLLMKPLSPLPHAYLDLPLKLVSAVLVAILVELILGSALETTRAALFRLMALLLLFVAVVPGGPAYCSWRRSLEAIEGMARGSVECQANRPAGYSRRPRGSRCLASYPWEDYCAVLRYLRANTRPTTRIANAMMCLPALNGPAGRLPAFPSESISLLVNYNRESDLDAYIRSLERTPDSVVAWAPVEKGQVSDLTHAASPFQLGRLASAIERLYEPEAWFGSIEVWRRKDTAANPEPQGRGTDGP